mmetsp:Transcript_12505/g.29517  ORF Transcript_12505/g.29517 Transcript_12505/m.29517 type:complete len:310 (+) Transcript_12505:375-1304(+)
MKIASKLMHLIAFPMHSKHPAFTSINIDNLAPSLSPAHESKQPEKVGQFDDDSDMKAIRSSSQLSVAPGTGQTSTSWRRRVAIGTRVSPALFLLPLYGIGFGAMGPKLMWAFSEWVSSFTQPSERWLFDHFDRTKRFLDSSTASASVMARSYRIHPTFAGLSLITTPVLAFVDASMYQHIISERGLLVANFCICVISCVAGRCLVPTMMGDKHAKRWNYYQGNLCVTFAALSSCPGTAWVGGLFAHLNWSLLFCAGVLERLYVLCVLPQQHLNKKEYMDRYSPMMKIAALGSIPLGFMTFFVRSVISRG